jgi:hypothetical protein
VIPWNTGARRVTGCKPADLIDTGDPMEHRRQKNQSLYPQTASENHLKIEGSRLVDKVFEKPKDD